MGIFNRSKAGAGRRDAARAAAPARYVWSRTMQLRVAAPQGPGWELMEAGPSPAGALAAIRCLRGEPPRALALNAYAHAVPAGQERTVAQLCADPWQARWLGSTFASIDSLSARAIDRPGSGPACEVRIEGRGGAPVQALLVRELHVPAGARRLVVSAAGPPEVHLEFAAVIETWLLHAALGE